MQAGNLHELGGYNAVEHTMSARGESLAGMGSRPDDFMRSPVEAIDQFGQQQARSLPSTGMTTKSSQPPGTRRTSTAAIFVLSAALIVGLLAWIWASGQGERFSATAVVQLEPAATVEDNREVVDILGSIDRGPIVVTLAGVANSGSVTAAAQERLGVTEVDMEDYEVEALQVLTSHLVDITVTGPDEALSIGYADAIADELRLAFAESHPVYQITTVTPATIPESSGRPSTAVIVIAAMIAAAIGAFMLWLALFGGSDERTDLPLARRP